jgi:hypothetical protein
MTNAERSPNDINSNRLFMFFVIRISFVILAFVIRHLIKSPLAQIRGSLPSIIFTLL